MRSPIEEKIVTARIALLLKKPFFGNMATRLKLIEKPEIGTAATDGRHLWYAPEFIERLNPKQTEFLLAHEVLHVAFEHMLRRGDRDPQAWNVACDYAINYSLVESGLTQMPKGVLLDSKYKGMRAEKIYDILNSKA